VRKIVNQPRKRPAWLQSASVSALGEDMQLLLSQSGASQPESLKGNDWVFHGHMIFTRVSWRKARIAVGHWQAIYQRWRGAWGHLRQTTPEKPVEYWP